MPLLRGQSRGRLSIMSSIAGITGDAGGSSYCGARFAVEGISECLSAELAPLGIQVTLVEPGNFRTGRGHEGEPNLGKAHWTTQSSSCVYVTE